MTGTASSGGFRLATRLARREVFRRPGRTFLVALLIALPVAGMTVAAVMVRTQHESPRQLWQAVNGQADATVVAPIKVKLPPYRAVPAEFYSESRVLRTADSDRSQATIVTLDLSSPITRGIVQIMSGHVPTKANEVFLTRDAAQQLGVKAGGTLQLVRPARRSFMVAGVGEFAQAWGGATMVLPSNAPYPWKRAAPQPQTNLLVKFVQRPSAAELHRLTASPATQNLYISPALLSSPSPFGTVGNDAAKGVAWSWVVGALVLTVVGIIIAAAFAVGARRQLVMLGQLAGNGAEPNVLRRVLFLQGTVTGLVGSIGGVGLGALALALLEPHVDQIFRSDLHPYAVRPTDVVPIILLGVATATIAALIPARAASRVPVLAALSGRRPLGKIPRWIPVTGAFVSAGGLALLGLAVLGGRGNTGHRNVWVLTAMAGGVAVLLGACAIAPQYVSFLEPAAARSRGSWRVATRSLARQRTRTSAVVSAIAATGALVIAASSLLIAAHDHNVATERLGSVRPDEVQLSGTGRDIGSEPPPASFVAQVAKVLPDSTAYQLSVPYRPNVTWSVSNIALDHHTNQPFVSLTSGIEITNDSGDSADYLTVGVADHDLLAEYGLSRADQRELSERGELVLADARGHATLSIVTHVAPHAVAPPPQKLQVQLVDGGAYRVGQLPSILVTPKAAVELGMTIQPSTLVLRAPHSLTTDQRNRIADIASDIQDAEPVGGTAVVNYQYYYPSTAIDPLLLEWLLVAVALVLTLFVVAVNLALSAAETRDERDVLTIVGAAPGTMSRTNGYKAGLLTAMGALLAIPIGLLPVAVFLAADDSGMHFVFPVWVIGLLVIAVPVAATAVTAGASALALRARPVRISTMAYD